MFARKIYLKVVFMLGEQCFMQLNIDRVFEGISLRYLYFEEIKRTSTLPVLLNHRLLFVSRKMLKSPPIFNQMNFNP